MPMRFVLTVVTPSGASRNHRHRCRRVMVSTSEVGKTSPMLSSAEEFRITAADVRVMRANVWQTVGGAGPSTAPSRRSSRRLRCALPRLLRLD